MLGSDGSLLVAQDKDIGGDDALKLRQKSEVRPSPVGLLQKAPQTIRKAPTKARNRKTGIIVTYVP
jgi:hypothetical protein